MNAPAERLDHTDPPTRHVSFNGFENADMRQGFLGLFEALQSWVKDHGASLNADVFKAVSAQGPDGFGDRFMRYCDTSPFDQYLATTQPSAEQGLVFIDSPAYERFHRFRPSKLSFATLVPFLKQSSELEEVRAFFAVRISLGSKREIPLMRNPTVLDVWLTKLDLCEDDLEMLQSILNGTLIRTMSGRVLARMTKALF